MKRSRAQTTPFLLLIITLSIACSACSRTETTSEATPPAPPPSAATTRKETMPTEMPATANGDAVEAEVPAPDLTPPQPAEVRRAVARVYEQAVSVDEAGARHAVVGDFNGDGSSDIAVVVRPSEKMLEEINSEVANWILEDPHGVVVPDPTQRVHHLAATEERVKVEAGDTLLAIIHGHQEKGWRNPAAKQTYLLKNAVGNQIKTHKPEEVKSAVAPGKRLPRLRGDVIGEKLGAESGMLFWTGAKYGWFH